MITTIYCYPHEHHMITTTPLDKDKKQITEEEYIIMIIIPNSILQNMMPMMNYIYTMMIYRSTGISVITMIIVK